MVVRPRRQNRDEEDDDLGTGAFGGGPPRSGSSTGRQPIGVPEDYRATDRIDLSGMSARAAEGWAAQGQGHGSLTERAPRYYEGDEWRPASDLSPAAIAEMQRRLVSAGLLTGNFRLGIWDATTVEAYRGLLTFANARGVTAEAAMVLYESGAMADTDDMGNIVSPEGASGAGVPTVPGLVTRITDPNILRDVFRRAVIDIAGEGWSQERINAAVLAYNAVERERQRSQYEAEIASQFEPGSDTVTDPTTGEALPIGQSGEFVEIPSPESYIESYVRDIDPESVQDHEALTFAGETMKMLGSTAWGVGGSQQF